jgi:NADH-quinone oxidoreductase subunit A
MHFVLADYAPAYREWAVLGILFVVAFLFAVGNLVASALLGPVRKGKIKDDTYESGMDPTGTTHQRFNVRFYLVAMIFLVFDVEVLFFIPWVTIFPKLNETWMKPYVSGVMDATGAFMAVVAFTAIILLAYVYAWAKGVFQWD